MDLKLFYSKALDYPGYMKLMESLVADGKTSGDQQSQEHKDITKLNLQRMQRLNKTLQVLPELQESLKRIEKNQNWLVLAESWCGDAAQNLPVIAAIAVQNSNVQIGILLRDENPDLMQAYLTFGARAIPKLIAFDSNSGLELFTWGPRPAEAQAIANDLTAKGVDKATKGLEIQKWYNHNKGKNLQLEFLEILESLKITA